MGFSATFKVCFHNFFYRYPKTRKSLNFMELGVFLGIVFSWPVLLEKALKNYEYEKENVYKNPGFCTLMKIIGAATFSFFNTRILIRICISQENDVIEHLSAPSKVSDKSAIKKLRAKSKLSSQNTSLCTIQVSKKSEKIPNTNPLINKNGNLVINSNMGNEIPFMALNTSTLNSTVSKKNCIYSPGATETSKRTSTETQCAHAFVIPETPILQSGINAETQHVRMPVAPETSRCSSRENAAALYVQRKSERKCKTEPDEYQQYVKTLVETELSKLRRNLEKIRSDKKNLK